MCTTSRKQTGFTLVELIFFIVVVTLGIAGILVVMDVSAARSADPMVRKQAMVLADSLLEEILLKEFADPDGVGGEATRATFDDVNDFHGINEVIPAGPVFTGMPALLNGYRIQIQVTGATLDTVDARRVSVTVSRDNENINMVGFRTDY
ncbi:MAG: prepilin-type N-terminal cleavage/methylation domain-containing protein [Hylemonella sp.]|nr:prepilin-type N-terminal cleavage/methylation domain-containing protein [Hylemonella sp.]